MADTVGHFLLTADWSTAKQHNVRLINQMKQHKNLVFQVTVWIQTMVSTAFIWSISLMKSLLKTCLRTFILLRWWQKCQRQISENLDKLN